MTYPTPEKNVLGSLAFPKEVIPTCSPGRLFVISAPAGAGKTTLVSQLLSYFPSLRLCMTYTTRKPRQGERDGVDYHFVSREEFLERISRGDFLEWVEIHGNLYGSIASNITKEREEGSHVIMVIDTEGAAKVRALMDPVTIFIMPPSVKELEQRLSARKSESTWTLQRRLERAVHEIEQAGSYDYSILNEDFTVALITLVCIISAEVQKAKHRRRNRLT